MRKKELDHLYLTKNERMGIFILFIFLLVLIIIPWLYYRSDSLILNNDINELVMNKGLVYSTESKIPLEQKESNDLKNKDHSSHSEVVFEAFEFDPNHLNTDEAKQLGINDIAYRTLQKYLKTGAKIKNATQFGKIYGIDHKTFTRLEPYIRISNSKKDYMDYHDTKLKPKTIVNLNLAASEDLVPLPGIAEKLSERIIKYRNILGGFIDVSQLYEVYGLHDSTVQKFKHMISIEGAVTKININKPDLEVLKKHPYIGANKAKIILEYRKHHPAFETLKDLYKLEALDSNWIMRVAPYLSFE